MPLFVKPKLGTAAQNCQENKFIFCVCAHFKFRLQSERQTQECLRAGDVVLCGITYDQGSLFTGN